VRLVIGHWINSDKSQWINGLHNHKSSTQFIHDLLDLIEHEMLVIETREMKRADSERVKSRLLELHQKCTQQSSYGLEPCPKPLKYGVGSHVNLDLKQAQQAIIPEATWLGDAISYYVKIKGFIFT
jgi:hypothetical protein